MTRLLTELKENCDPQYKKFNDKLIPNVRSTIGVRVPVLRKIASELMKEDWRSFLDEDVIVFEENIIKAIVIANAEMSSEERLALTEEFVPNVDNWAVCDLLCGDWKITQDAIKPLWDLCKELMASKEEFRMRVAAVMMLSKFLDDEHIDGVLALLTMYSDDGYYYKMGAAWTLSYCYIDYQEKTEEVLRSGELDREIHNLTIRKVCESRRVSDDIRKHVRTFKR